MLRSAWRATTPISASAHPTCAPTASTREATAMPISPVAPSLAMIEKVANAACGQQVSNAARRSERRMAAEESSPHRVGAQRCGAAKSARKLATHHGQASEWRDAPETGSDE